MADPKVNEDRMKLIFPFLRGVVGVFKPIVRLSEEGKTSLNNGRDRRGRLMSITPNGYFRVRKFGCKSVATYHPGWWVLNDDQEPERDGDR